MTELHPTEKAQNRLYGLRFVITAPIFAIVILSNVYPLMFQLSDLYLIP